MKLRQLEITWRSPKPYLIAMFVVVGILISFDRGSGKGEGSDFHVFWLAGKHFFDGLPLYETLPGHRRFIYPPFAAMVFQVLGCLPVRVSAILWSLVNFAFWYYSVVLVLRIAAMTMPTRNKKSWPMILAVLFSARFFLNNINLAQMNELILVLVLMGIWHLLSKRHCFAAAMLSAATCIKLVPVFFLFWGGVRGGRKTTLWIAVWLSLFTILPIVQRGPEQGIKDLRDYYTYFLRDFQEGKVDTKYTNQNFPALVYRAGLENQNPKEPSVRYVSLTKEQADTIIRIVTWLLIAAFGAFVIHRKIVDKRITFHEVLTPFLLAHLLAGITRKAHLVTLVVVFYGLFSPEIKALSKSRKGLLCACWGLAAFAGLTGRELVGKSIHMWLGASGIVVWSMLVWLLASMILSYETSPAVTRDE